MCDLYRCPVDTTCEATYMFIFPATCYMFTNPLNQQRGMLRSPHQTITGVYIQVKIQWLFTIALIIKHLNQGLMDESRPQSSIIRNFQGDAFCVCYLRVNKEVNLKIIVV